MEKESAKILSDMSHELRTPLNVIVGMCDIASHHVEDGIKVRDCLMKISNASEHLTKILNEFLDITIMEQGAMPVREEVFDLTEMLEALRLMVEPMAVRKRQTCIISSDGIRNRVVKGSQSNIMRVLINLATNAVKYTPDGGMIRISADEVCGHENGGITYRFICQDSGMGMTREFTDRIFEPFARADDAKASDAEGKGLGMAIVKEIVDTMGGHVHVDSIKDVGTDVCVLLELKPAV